MIRLECNNLRYMNSGWLNCTNLNKPSARDVCAILCHRGLHLKVENRSDMSNDNTCVMIHVYTKLLSRSHRKSLTNVENVMKLNDECGT